MVNKMKKFLKFKYIDGVMQLEKTKHFSRKQVENINLILYCAPFSPFALEYFLPKISKNKYKFLSYKELKTLLSAKLYVKKEPKLYYFGSSSIINEPTITFKVKKERNTDNSFSLDFKQIQSD